MKVDKIQLNNYNNHPSFGKMVFEGGVPQIQKAIKDSYGFQRLSNEMEKMGKNLIFSLGDGYGGTYMIMRANDTYLDMIAATQPYNVNKMIKQIKEYSCDTLLKGIQAGKELFNK